MNTTQNFYSDVDANGIQSSANDKNILESYLSGNREYMPAEYWRLTTEEKKDWVSKIYPIMTDLNDHSYVTSDNIDERFTSDNFSVQDFLTGNGYSPTRDDFGLIHEKYNLDYNGLFNFPIYIARVHSDDGTWNHGFSVVNKGTNLNDPNNWIFLEPQLGKIVEAGSESIPFNSRILIYGVKNFKDAYDLGVMDEPRKTVAIELHIDSQGNREVTYINPNMIIDQTSLGVGDENTKNSSPQSYSLGQNYPNPFNPTTKIPYSLDKQADISLDIYDIKGRHVRNLEKGAKQPGAYIENFNGSNLPSGNYIVNLKTSDGYTQSKKISLVK